MINKIIKHKVKRFTGVYYVESTSRKCNGKADIGYYICYRNRNNLDKWVLVWEKIGWKSEGITAQYASQIRNERMRDMCLGEEVITIQQRKKGSLTFKDFMINKYLPYSMNNKKPKSYKIEKDFFRLWIDPIIQNKSLKDVTPFDIERIKQNMKDKGKSNRTIEYALSTIRTAYNMAKKWGLYNGDNPMDSVNMPKVNNQRVKFLSYEEATILLEACKTRSEQLYEISIMSLNCGLRAGEIFNLTWQDINFDEQIKSITIKDPKNNTTRFAYMTEKVLNILKNKPKGQPTELIFKSKNNSMIESISKSFDRAVKECGFNKGVVDRRNKVVFHTLRHTFASWLAINGRPLHVIKELLGHKTLMMTERYSHLIPDVKKEAIKIFDVKQNSVINIPNIK